MADTQEHSRSIGLALSGGGARCYAQIGVIKAIEEAGWRVSAIAANSSAAILAAIYASCADARELERVALGIDFTTFLDPDGSTGLIGHAGVYKLLEEHAAATFEELRIPLAVPTVDIERAESLVFSEGPLAPPVAASNAFPGLFVPVEYLGRHLVDGGIVNNFPVDVIRTLTNRPVLAVDVRPSPSAPLDLDSKQRRSLLERLGSLFGNGLPATVEILMQAYNITQDRVVEITCALHPPDLRLRPDLPHDLDIQSFDRIEEAVEIGYRSAKEAMAAGRFAALDGSVPA